MTGKGPTAANFEALRDQLDLAVRAADRATAYSIGRVLDGLRAEASAAIAWAEMTERMKEPRPCANSASTASAKITSASNATARPDSNAGR